MKNNSKPVMWLTFNNIFPIITSLVAMTLAFAALKSDVALLNQKVDMVLARQEEILKKYANVETRYGELALKIQAVETEHAMNRR